MFTDDKIEQILDKIIEKTKEKKINWKYIDTYRSETSDFPNYTLELYYRDQMFSPLTDITILDKNRRTVKIISGEQNYNKIKQVYDAIYSKDEERERCLDELLGTLDNL